jgi:hypothetical protein
MSGSRWTLLASLLRSVTVAWASKIVKRFTDRIFPPACVWVRCGDECRSASSVFGPAESSEDLGPHIWRLLFTSSTIEHRAASAQAVVDILQWPELIPVTDLASACQPIEVIVEQGRGAWIMPHFGAFADVVEDLLAVQQAPTVDPRPGCSAGSQKGDKREEGGRRLFGLWS